MEMGSYELVEKDGPDGPLRGTGLAMEECHRTCKVCGLGQLKHKRVPTVWLNGEAVQHRASASRAWNKARLLAESRTGRAEPCHRCC